MRLTRLVVGALGAALLGAVPVPLVAAPAQAVTPSHLVMTWTEAGTTYAFGDEIVIRAQVLAPCGSTWCPVEDPGRVELRRTMKGSTTSRLVATAYGDSAGRVALATPSAGNATYTVVYGGGTDRDLGPTSQSRSFQGSRSLDARPVRTDRAIYYRGDVDPGWGRQPVTIQRKTCRSCGWRTFETVRTSRSGAYSSRIYAPRTGRWYYRAVVEATSPRFVRGIGVTVFTYRPD